jgi:hypothetical protein
MAKNLTTIVINFGSIASSGFSLASQASDALHEKCSDLIEEGWLPVGPPTARADGDGDGYVAMTLYRPPERRPSS